MRMRPTNRWVGCPAVARAYAGGLALVGLHSAPTAATGIAVTLADGQPCVALKPFQARPFEESSP